MGRSHHHGLTLVAELFEAPAAELLAVVDRELGHSVEGTHRDGRIDAGDAVEAVDETLAALHILVVDIAVILLGSIERRLGHNLSDKGWREAGLTELHHRATHLGVLGDQGSDAYSALAVALGH